MATTVVNIRTLRPDEYDVYIGRFNASKQLARSKWANPFQDRALSSCQALLSLDLR